MLIFFMNQIDTIYMKFTLALLVISEILDVIWLFMNSGTYWNLPKVGPFSPSNGRIHETNHSSDIHKLICENSLRSVSLPLP